MTTADELAARVEAWKLAYNKVLLFKQACFDDKGNMLKWVEDANCEGLANTINQECRDLWLAYTQDAKELMSLIESRRKKDYAAPYGIDDGA